MWLETFQSLTSQSEHGQEFGTSPDFCFDLYNPQTLQYSPRKTQREFQSQAEEFSQAHRQEHTTYFTTPLLPQHDTTSLSQVQRKYIGDTPTTEREEKVNPLEETKYRASEKSRLKEKEDRDNPHSGETECRINQSVSKPTAFGSTSFRGKREMEDMSETIGKSVCEENLKGQIEPTALHSTMAVCSCDATSADRWEQCHKQDNPHVLTLKYPSSVYESMNFVQHFNISPPCQDNSVLPLVWTNQEIIVSFKASNDHIERVTGLNMETQSTGCAETKTHFHLCHCSKSRAGRNMRSNCVKGHKQAMTTACCLSAANNTSQASTPLNCSTVPIQSITRSPNSSGSSWKDGDKPSSQWHQFPKLSFPPPCSDLQDSHLNQSEEDYASDTFSKAEKGWMLREQDQRLGSGLEFQQPFSLSSLNSDDRTHDNSNGNFNIYVNLIVFRSGFNVLDLICILNPSFSIIIVFSVPSISY